MKVFVTENNYGEDCRKKPLGWYFLADSAVSNTGKPFYLPENRGKVVATLSAAIRVSRLGKSVAPKFANRYYSEIAPVLHFTLPDYKSELLKEGVSADASRNFDRSLFVGNFLPYSLETDFRLNKNGEEVSDFRIDFLCKNINEVLREISVMNTLKMGDLVLPGLSYEVEIKEGDLLEVLQDDIRAFHVKIR